MEARYVQSGAAWTYPLIESSLVGWAMPLQLSVTVPPGATVLGVAVRVAAEGGGTGLELSTSTRPDFASKLVVSFANSRKSYVPGVVGIVMVQEPDAFAAAPAVGEQLLV